MQYAAYDPKNHGLALAKPIRLTQIENKFFFTSNFCYLLITKQYYLLTVLSHLFLLQPNAVPGRALKPSKVNFKVKALI